MSDDKVEIPESVARDMERLRAYFPYRIIWCAYKDGEWVHGGSKTRHVINTHLRKGYAVFIVKGEG